jgi:hypothetical protein
VKKPHRSKDQKLREAVMDMITALRDIEPKIGIAGVSQRYLDAFERYSEALNALVEHACGMHIVDWDWDGYEARFAFRWDFSAQLQQPNRPEFDTRFVAMSTHARFDDAKPLDDELARLRAEAAHYQELTAVAMRWARDVAIATRKES